jgi:type I restriction enzyme M protein
MNHNPNIPQLFRNIFKNAYLPYRDPETLKMFLKVIGEFEYDYSEKLGDAFEYLLSIMGSQGDAGQFRTPRHIIDFMVKVVDPSKNETILDPACGTAGFLISSFTHICNKNKKDGRINLTPDERARLIENLSGYDISPDMVRLSLVNMYLHGFQSPKIYEYDTLASEEKWNEFYDIILANPPFMSPRGGIKPHKRFSVQANRSEVLFVDYIEEHLNPNGRAGVIVPEGIIFQSGIAYKKLRKMLIESSLYAVVSLPAGVFNPYSGVKTSILFLNKNLAKKTDKILFVKVNNDGLGLGAQRREIKENDLPLALEIINKYKQCIIEEKEIEFNLAETKLAHMVKKEKIAENSDYNLSSDRYRETVIYNGKWDFVELGEVCEFVRGPFGGTLKKEIFVEKGYKVYEQKHAIQNNFKIGEYYINFDKFQEMERFEVKTGDLIISCSGTMGRIAIVPQNIEKGIINQALLKLTPDYKKINVIFLKLLLETTNIQNKYFKNTSGAAIKNVASVKSLKTIKIPLPPLEIQEQIVAELDSYQKIINGAKQVVENYKPTFKIDSEWENLDFDKVCTLEYGKSLPKIDRKQGKYPVMGSNGISGYHDNYFIKGPAIIVGRKGSAGEVVWEERDCFPIDTTYYIKLNKPQNTSLKFIYFILKSFKLQNIKNGAGIPGLNRNDVYLKYKIPFPSLEIQQQIANRIENEQKIIDANKELITIFENKIKEKIAETWGGS